MKDRHYLVIDLEATCWPAQEKAPAPNEIIEIGLTILAPSKAELWTGGWFVRPTVCPILSEFCRKLTSIDQADVDAAPPFPGVMKIVEDHILQVTGRPANESLFVSWGNYDRNQFERDCALHGYPYPFGEHFNLKQAFSRHFRLKKAGLDSACRHIGLPMVGTHHRGKDDAMNVARILRQLDLPGA